MENKSSNEKNLSIKSPSKNTSISWSAIGLAFSTFAIIILIIVFTVSFYKISILGKKLQVNTVALEQRVGIVQNNLDNLHQDIQRVDDATKQTITQMRQEQNTDKNTWRVLEAEYYVKLAAAALEFQSNAPVAIQLLQTADKELQLLNDSKLDSLRKALAEDITHLQAISAVDYTGIYLRLSALDSQVNNLPFIIKHTPDNAMPTAETATNSSWWQHGLNDTWKALQKIVVARYHAAGVPPLVTPDQQDFIRQNLHAMFTQAMWAVLNKKAEVYRASLQQINQWIQQYFVTDAAVTQGELSAVNELQHIDINPSIPKITDSIQAFHDYLEKSSA